MLFKTFNYKALLFLFCLGILSSCGKDDTTTPTDDDPAPGGFLGVPDFVKTFGGSDEDDAVSIVQASDGGYVIAGTTKSTDGDITDKTGTDADYWVLKLNQEGDKVWSKTYGGSEDDRATNMTKTSDGGYILCGYSRSNDGDVTGNSGFQDYWLLKIDSSGNLQWQKSFGFSGSDQAFKVFETVEGNFFATGFLDVTASGGLGNDFTNGGQPVSNTRNPQHGVGEYWGILMDSQGNKIWRRYFGGTNNDRSYDTLQTADGGFLLVGASESSDFDITDAKGSYDLWIVRLTATGDKLWTKSFGGSEIDIGYSVSKTHDGNYLIVGDTRSNDQDVTNSYGNADVWAVKFNDSGALIWQKNYGGSEFDSARSVKQISNGRYLLSGSTRSSNGQVASNNGQNDAWVMIIDENGALEYEYTMGGSNLDFSNSAIETTDGKLVMVGNTESNDLDIPLNRGVKDLVILKLK